MNASATVLLDSSIVAHFAEIDENNVVIRVIAVPDEQEHRGADFCSVDLGLGGTWLQTSYNANIRGMFAGVGDSYDPETDTFIKSTVAPESA